MDCEKAGGLMMKYMDGAITDAEASSLNRHIQSCTHCEEDFRAYDSIVRGFSGMKLTEAPEGFEARVMGAIMALPETAAKPISRPLYGVMGVFSVLMGLGFFLVSYKGEIFVWLSQYPAMKPLLDIYAPVSESVNGVSAQVSSALAWVSGQLALAGPVAQYACLFVFGALALTQAVIYRRERKIAGK